MTAGDWCIRSRGRNKQIFVTTAGPGNDRVFVNVDEGLAASHWGYYIQSSPLVDSSIAWVPGTWTKLEGLVQKPTGADNDGIVRLWVDGALGVNITNASVAGGSFPEGNFVSVYDDGSNNGNHYPLESDPRKIGTNLGVATDAYRWISALYVSTP